jgi:hypothetical protein
MNDTKAHGRLLAETGHAILTMGVNSSEAYLALSSEAEREAFLRALFDDNDVVYLVFWLNADEYTFLPAKGDRALVAASPATKANAFFVDSFESAVLLGMGLGDADARRYLPVLTPSSIPPTSRFRPYGEAFLTAAEERRQRRAAKRAKEAGRG